MTYIETVGPNIVREHFGHLPDGATVERVRLCGRNGFELAVITFGATVQSLHVPDRTGRCADIVLGHDDFAPYFAHRRYFGATIGRYANRIAHGSFLLDGRRFQVTANDGVNSLHGGVAGFDQRLWSIEALTDDPAPSMTLAYISPDGEEGYPGTLSARVTYTVTEDIGFSIAFEAMTDRPTVVNLTHHGFFNLAGVDAAEDVLDHELLMMADAYLPVDETLIPLGGPEPVVGTPFDFRQPQRIGARLRNGHEQLRLAQGYDHNFCLQGGRTEAPRLAARVLHRASGRGMELFTDQPGLQFYSGNFLDGSVPGKRGRLYRQADAFCLEPQAWPDAPNRLDYSSVRLDPGEVYRHLSFYRFYST
ncbi:aldose epimerase family protein [Beijerinckia indica]|uniref:Aldose 1-epimerase n=1 Tax=Beijerinckia indica subsp. indica (strain ATCC 9039 / DSM 1715 / NCIMB 8712) TaxID=395963 RepID=B2IBL1_BEII9|nr:aldose epimerase family protein [Beijerinckia indica]ACB96637.1 Aldose 1-epimerase [Beijerinckia indica subsp. indica ATCC 9039]